jgi:hypothetical protein
VSSFGLASQKVYWSLNADCPPVGPNAAGEPSPQAAGDPVTLSRVPSRGGDARQIFSRNDPRSPGVCNPYKIVSNVVADERYLYWVDATGLVRLSVDANPGDAPEQMNGNVGASYAELAIAGDRIYGLSNKSLWGIDTSGPGPGFAILSFSDAQPTNLSFDGQYLYLLVSGALRRITPAGDVLTIDTGVSAYYATGFIDVTCDPFDPFCGDIDRVFYAKGNVIRLYDTIGSSNGFFKEEPAGTQISKLLADNNRVFAYETTVAIGCPGLCNPIYTDSLYRIPISYNVFVGYRGGASELLTQRSRNYAAVFDIGTPLRADGTFIFWQEDNKAIKRIYPDAAAVPVVNLTLAEPQIEVTQAVQKADNSVPLIQNRRTFVRVFVRSEGVAVAGVTAALFVSAAGRGTEVLAPIGAGGGITAYTSPNRNAIDQSFLFELPLEWTRQSQVGLSARVNPNFVPAEPSYADNDSRGLTVTFNPSSRLDVTFVKVRYRAGPPDKQTWYEPSAAELQAINAQIRRLFPVASTAGYASEPSPGFRPRVYSVDDDGLSERIQFKKADSCKYLLTPKLDKDGKQVYENGKAVFNDNRAACPTIYVNDRLAALRTEWGLGGDAYMYGLMSATGAPDYPRGWASGHNTASGPSDDFLTAAHEIGHMIGQRHPFPGSAYDTNQCGNSIADGGVDSNFPYPNSQVGPNDGTVNGFDVGSKSIISAQIGGGGPGIPIYHGLAVKPGATSYDIMGYCYPTAPWISDYTYNCIFRTLRDGAHPSDCFKEYTPPTAAALRAKPTARPPQPYKLGPQAQPGDWLHLVGAINGDGSGGAINHIRRVDSVHGIPPRTPGAYSVRLLDAAGNSLADYPFTPDMAGHGGALGFEIVAPFVAGTREVRVVASATPNVALASVPVSAAPPAVSGVALLNPANPVVGSATLGWSAGDPDGGALTFDVLYSRDGGSTFLPLASGLSGTSAAFEAAQLGGGGAIFRVVASDGVQSAQADSPPYTLAAAPPQPAILSAADGMHVRWGEVLTLSGEATDAQDNGVLGANLAWSTQRGPLGAGSDISVRLPAGPNQITLTATNSAGISASTTITVYVDDTVQVPGPTLSVAPGEVAWSVAPGAAGPQTAQLALSNAGAGALSWAASSNAPWLTLSAASGSAPAALTLSADVSGLAEGTTLTTTVTLTQPGPDGTPVQTIAVPVSLSVGNTISAVPTTTDVGDSVVFLPLVSR